VVVMRLHVRAQGGHPHVRGLEASGRLRARPGRVVLIGTMRVCVCECPISCLFPPVLGEIIAERTYFLDNPPSSRTRCRSRCCFPPGLM